MYNKSLSNLWGDYTAIKPYDGLRMLKDAEDVPKHKHRCQKLTESCTIQGVCAGSMQRLCFLFENWVPVEFESVGFPGTSPQS